MTYSSESESMQSRPATLRDFLALVDAFNCRKVQYAIIGGFAMIAHGFSRSTRDIDLLVPADVENGKKMKEVLLLMPEKSARGIDPAWFVEDENIRVNDAYVINIMLNANGETYESLLPYIETKNIDGIPVPVLTMEGMLKTKNTGREKDIPDRIFLERHIEWTRKSSPPFKPCI